MSDKNPFKNERYSQFHLKIVNKEDLLWACKPNWNQKMGISRTVIEMPVGLMYMEKPSSLGIQSLSTLMSSLIQARSSFPSKSYFV